ncbi:FCD domain-containing protein [Heliobacterium gestii]|uniref:FCD domain-containing protein n=1 Tax=Heliomicrobium gestii TaxID=2699 RepID=A0A845LID7_HELGE|nr:FCD domain-containing protein [Heliomicrobium gestii]MBM7866056.1 GntR family L-lactate dehydrogenase operon transcriptional regulator [Heliomicrobium gestii]MZP42616.1 FCD domain-containing protein [Heliomicrobium gestii]
MLSHREAQEQIILSVIDGSTEPVGSGSIRAEAARRGLEMSEATVGRVLKNLDNQGFSVRKGFQGRQLTEAGKRRLMTLNQRQEQSSISMELVDALSQERKKTLLDMMVARRAIEGEIAALAARAIRPEEVAEMEQILREQERLCQEGRLAFEQDIAFHQILARACRNPVLEKALELIYQSGRHSLTLEAIRREVYSGIMVDHRNIFASVLDGDSEAARTSMVTHLENVIADIERLWQKHDME